MKSLKEREWFFSQDREELVSTPPGLIYNPDPHYDMYRLKTTRQLVADINLDFGLVLKDLISSAPLLICILTSAISRIDLMKSLHIPSSAEYGPII